MRARLFARLLSPAPLAVAAACASSRGVTVASPSPMQAGAPSSAAFVVTLGRDTLGVERFTRSGSRLVGDFVSRQPSTAVSHYEVTLASDGTPVRLDYQERRADGTAIPGRPRSVAVLYQGDTAVTQLQMDSVVTRRTVGARGAIPYFGSVFGVYELALARMRAAKADTGTIVIASIGAAQASELPVAFYGADSARIWYFGDPMVARVDASGRLLGLDATRTTDKIQVARVESLELDALARHFAALDAAGKGLGALASPRDTVRATIAGAQLWVDYGRPSTRGRDVWARGVLGDTLWRTGANAATQFQTDRDLVIAGRAVPAGKYTLFTHTAASGYELVINKETGQWGTDYHPAQDLVRVPLTATSIPDVEQFTIALVPQGAGGAIHLRWGPRQLAVAFEVK